MKIKKKLIFEIRRYFNYDNPLSSTRPGLESVTFHIQIWIEYGWSIFIYFIFLLSIKARRYFAYINRDKVSNIDTSSE